MMGYEYLLLMVAYIIRDESPKLSLWLALGSSVLCLLTIALRFIDQWKKNADAELQEEK